MVNERTNKQPALESKKGPEQQYTSISRKDASSISDKLSTITAKSDITLEGFQELVKLAKDAEQKNGSLGPGDVAKILNEKIIPNAQELAQVANEIRDGLPGVEGGMSSGNDEQKPKDTGNSEPKMELDEDTTKRIGSMEEQIKTLMTENKSLKVAKLAEEYASAFPKNMREAKEKEIKDSDMDYQLLHAKVNSFLEGVKLAKNDLTPSKVSVSGSTYGEQKTAKADGARELMPSYMR